MQRLRELDGIRGVAILLVLIWHYFNRQIEPSTSGILAYPKLFTNVTWSGVDLFFVLSGFLIGGILFDHRCSSNYFRVFYIRRACRILPVYLLVVGLFLLFSQRASPSYNWLFANALPAWTYLSFTQNYFLDNFVDAAHWLDPTWSLAVEEQFYLVLPPLIRIISAPLVLPILLVLILLGPVTRHQLGGLGAYSYAFCRADALIMGVLLAWIFRKRSLVQFVAQRKTLFWGIFSIMVVLTTVVPLVAYGFGGVGNHLWFALLYGLLLLLVIVFPDSAVAELLRHPVFVWLGVRSYFIYLTHQPVSGLLHGAIFSGEPRIDRGYGFLVTLAALATVLYLARLSYRYFEVPFLSFGRKFSYKDHLPRNTL